MVGGELEAEGNVFANAAGVQGWFLLDKSEVRAVVARVQGGEGVRAEENATGGRVVEALEEADGSAFATAGGADESDELAG